jgi:thiol-disulfide isomerase/thioredoxin
MKKILVAVTLAVVVALAGCTKQPAGEGKAPAPIPKAAGQPTAGAQDVSALEIEFAGGEKHAMKEYAGRIVVLDFWATFCKPCIEKLPHLEEMAKKWGPGVVVIAVTLDPDMETATSWAKKHKMGLPIAMYSDAMKQAFFKDEETVVIPQTRLIDWSGKQAKSWGPDGTLQELDKEVQALLSGGAKGKG